MIRCYRGLFVTTLTLMLLSKSLIKAQAFPDSPHVRIALYQPTIEAPRSTSNVPPPPDWTCPSTIKLSKRWISIPALPAGFLDSDHSTAILGPIFAPECLPRCAKSRASASKTSAPSSPCSRFGSRPSCAGSCRLLRGYYCVLWKGHQVGTLRDAGGDLQFMTDATIGTHFRYPD